MQLFLDFRTTAVFSTFLLYLSFFVMLYIHKKNKTYPGFGMITLQSFLSGTGILLISLRNYIPVFLSVVISNIFILTGLLLIKWAAQQICNSKKSRKRDIPLMLMHLILYTYFTFFQNSINIRVIIQSFFLLIIALQISVLSLTEVKAVYNSMHIPFTLSSIILTFFHSSRFLFYILYSEAETNFMSAHIINSVLAVIHFSGLYVFQILFIILCYFKAYTDLNESKKEIIHLQELLPICSHCHKIRDDKGYWEKIDLFIQKNSEIQFSHGLCPECLEKYYSEYTGKTKSSE